MNPPCKIMLLGFGEVGQTLADDLLARGGVVVTAWDRQFPVPDSLPSRAVAIRNLERTSGRADAVRDADLIISAVTAAQTAEAAHSVAPDLAAGAFYLDLNSASPGAKHEAAQHIEAAGGRYVEGAVMSPIAPKRIGSPILLGGLHARDGVSFIRDLGFSGASVFSEELGAASAAKLSRSVIVKGLEALITEALLTARHYGVEETVLASLSDLLPGPDWPTLSRYMIGRSIEHGVRRAEEMREAARTVAEAGLTPSMSAACAERQDWAPQFGEALSEPGLGGLLTAMRARLDATGKD